MQVGAVSLMQIAKASQMLGQLDEAGILTISLITDPTFGGVAASFATLCDVIIAEPGARLGFAGPRVISQTIRQTLPEGFQTAEFLLSHGLIDAIRPRSELRATIARLLSNGAKAKHELIGTEALPTNHSPHAELYSDPWQAVQRARHLERPPTADYLGLLLEDFEELRGDRLGEDCAAIIGDLPRL